MFEPRLERLAVTVRQAAQATALPVDLRKIADFDDILLQPVELFSGFNGKIEFLPEENVFVIYHPDPATYPYPTRLRFSIAHELGHYHIDEHRSALVRGETHASSAPFLSKNPREVEADEFAAALLIPAASMDSTIEKRGFLTLQQICRIAAECEVSRYAAGIRYVRMASEVCLIVLAHRGAMKSQFSSDEARQARLGWLEFDRLPPLSPAHALISDGTIGEIREIGHCANSWFNRNLNHQVWESCVLLGEGYTLSLLSLEKS